MKSESKKKSEKKGLNRIVKTNVLLWRSFSLLTVAIIMIIALVSYGVLGNAFYNRAKARISGTGEEVCAIVRSAKPITEKESELKELTLVTGADAFVIGDGGEVLMPYGFKATQSWSDILLAAQENSGEWAEGKTSVYSTHTDGGYTLNFVGCEECGGRECMVLVRYPLSSIAQSVRQMQLYIIIIAAAAIAITFFVSYFVAEKLSRPLRDMSATAKRLAAGDYSVEFASAQYSEIADLSAALNYMKDEIKKSGDFQKELIANVSHDLKTPLTMIKAYASMIQEISGDDKQKRNKHLQVIIDESDRLTGLVNDVLSTSKISAGIDQLNKKVFNLTEYLYGVINKFGYLTETQGYNIMVDIDPNLYTFADEEKIGQVLYNLISNAVNYTGEDKYVYITLKYSAEENRIKFSVRDTGKGINDEELSHIWDRYYRSNDSHTRPIKGTGLGLSIVKAILSNHAFEYGVTSEEGYGSTFYVDFPAVDSLQ